MQDVPQQSGLYDPRFEHDACGIGAVVDIAGRPSRQIVDHGREVLINLLHRGATGGDETTGDGAGILLQVPHALLTHELTRAGVELPEMGQYGVAMLFLPVDSARRAAAETVFANAVSERGLRIIAWRDVPTRGGELGRTARTCEPVVRQAFVTGDGLAEDALERRLYTARRRAEQLIRERVPEADNDCYICSMSCRTIVYKGMFIAPQLFAYYADLTDERTATAIAIVHQRYSTNTFPSWHLAQPFRMIAHNGEINTLRGNAAHMQAREHRLSAPLLDVDLKTLGPVISPGSSDSAALDSVAELITRAGRTLPHTMMMLIPEAFGAQHQMSTDKRAFYEYHAAIMEPWDGPAAVIFTDGRYVGAMLDRNGLRPGRYSITRDGLVVLASETGVVDLPVEQVQKKGRLEPGRLFLVDITEQRIVGDSELKSHTARQKPYRRWLDQNRIEPRGLFSSTAPTPSDPATITTRLRTFGYSQEDLDLILRPMALNGQEPIGSMGTDTPLAVLSKRPRLLFDYFKQQFAQVTNPAIDPLREGLVMSLMTFAGRDLNLLDESPAHCRQLKLQHPVLTNEDLHRLRSIQRDDLHVVTLDATFEINGDTAPARLAAALARLRDDAEAAINDGAFLLVISDRNASERRVPIPILLATTAVHYGLLERGVRGEVGLLIESGEPREVMHFCLLCGYGASAVNPYLAFEAIDELSRRGDLPETPEPGTHSEHYINAIKKGILKTMSKMGISTLRSYRGAQLFEALGLDRDVIDRFFPATPSRIGGVGLEVIAREAYERHAAAYGPRRAGALPIDHVGEYQVRLDGEQHAWSPTTVALLQSALRGDDEATFRRFTQQVDRDMADLCALRGLFDFTPASPVPLDEVEPANEIVKRFCTGAMSHGSISKETHETLARAMNRIGGASNTGEGGEDPARYTPGSNGDSLNSAIKQVASARFGVTAHYLSQAREIQIKVAQGAKPGEGGQLPGFKVSSEIARLRHSTPGVSLISPPPHHDIYSIEDLAQLIYDLKCARPGAEVSVKLVSEVGVGTVAAGVAKANADEVLISGFDGGTGASPLSSIKHAGVPWELGLAETQQTLMLNGLRDRIRVQVDGGLRTGRDVVIGALLGAERFGFGTVVLVALGCILVRKCHLGTCPVGIATQRNDLRARFAGLPEHVQRYFAFLAEDVRRHMAALGYRRFDDMVGQTERLRVRKAEAHWKSRGLDISGLIAVAPETEDTPRRRITRQRDVTQDALDRQILAEHGAAIDAGRSVRVDMPIRNVHRTTGAMLSNRIVERHGPDGLAADTVECVFRGSAGQSFGAFLATGVLFRLIGDANDYLGKGLSGGRIVAHPPDKATFEPRGNIIAGNTLLYGATRGEVLLNGTVGERFAVRNSGATAVVEGVGDHACEYMTGGVVVVLGRTGRNFAAGMTGGVAYVLDEEELFDTRCNLDTVELEAVWQPADRELLRSLIAKHRRWTGSRRAQHVLNEWPAMIGQFVKVMPIDYRKALERQRAEETATSDMVPATEEVFDG